MRITIKPGLHKLYKETAFCPGSVRVHAVDSVVMLTSNVDDMNLAFPMSSPDGKTLLELSFARNTVRAFYDSAWYEFLMMSYAGSCAFRTRVGYTRGLPNVKPETVIHGQSSTGQLIISRVEKTPFGVPCAAILQLDKIDSVEDVGSLYIFPEKPIIIETFAATEGAGRVHTAVNIPSTGATFGDVPNVYAWVSPDKKRHGWVFIPYGRFEIVGAKRPKWWRKDRCVSFDPIWYETTPNEPYILSIGKKAFGFPSLPLNGNKEITRLQIEEVVVKSRVG